MIDKATSVRLLTLLFLADGNPVPVEELEVSINVRISQRISRDALLEHLADLKAKGWAADITDAYGDTSFYITPKGRAAKATFG